MAVVPADGKTDVTLPLLYHGWLAPYNEGGRRDELDDPLPPGRRPGRPVR